MDATAWARDLRRRLTDPGEWSRRRVAGECLLAAGLALLAGWAESGVGQGWALAVPVAFAVAVLALVRRALPTTALLAGAVLSGGTENGAGLLLLAVLGWSAGRRIDGVLRALAAFCVSFVVYVALGLWQAEQTPGLAVLFYSLFFLVSVVVPGLTSRYWTQRRTLLHTLQQRNAQLLRERQMVAGQARMRERQRIAQDMHDSLGHQLALIAVQTGALEVDRTLTGRQREAVGVLREASVAAMHELREVVGILKDGTPDEDQAGSRVVSGIGGLVDAAVAAGMKVSLERSGEPRALAPAADHAGYRVAQEGLTNAAKHAPGASIAVSLRYEPDSLLVEVANGPVPEGVGAQPPDAVSGGQGLTGLRERARLIGGMVFSGPARGGGFRLAAVIPYDSAEAREARVPASGEATFVDGTDDFWQQPGARTPGDGGPVIDRLDPREEFKDIVSTKKNNGCLIGCGVVLLIVAGLVAAALFGAGKLMEEADKGMIDPSDYASVHVGDPERQVRDRLPSGSSFLTSDVRGKIPAEPAGASCLALLSSDTSRGLTTDTVYRFCFKDGKLSEKREFHVKS
ncbi:sensor histidine kinase [Streptomyces cinnamoneus]|uniref:sensor histidine kinase n=1 Tax=Streptomyces cinnamoneus TaxID=53446 RepID=UPI001EFE6B8F|nr:histidine kinase [Streptomyces cinnamoneus]